MMLRLIRAEFSKLRRSLIVLLVLSIPLVVMVLLMAIVLSGNGPDDWQRLAMSGSAIWAYFLLPMTATALTALMAQIEHTPRAWSHVLALPVPKWQVFAAKAFVAAAMMAVISGLLLVAILLGGSLAGLINPEQALIGDLPVTLLALLLLKMWLAGWMVLAIQFTVAMRFASFAVAVIVGIAGTFIAVVATSAKAGIYFPWLLPTNILASDPDRAFQALLTGSIGGLLLFALACYRLGRRDWH